jgi:xanthine dehydrogenase accessory factor
MMGPELTRRARELAGARAPYVVATVVRAQRPASVRPGDVALVLGDGAIEGFVGGTCAEQSVRLHALRALETGEPLLLRILPGDGQAPASEGAVTVQNPCLSGGAMEIFLEPMLPAPRVHAMGATPVADALVRLGGELGLDIVAVPEGEPPLAEGDLAVVVASHGRDEPAALRGALEAGVPYVGLVASRVRGAAVADELRGAGVRVDALETPAGMDIGARTPAEIALAILARIVAVRRREHAPPASAQAGDPEHPLPASVPRGPDVVDPERSEPPESAPHPSEAVDPVCGMTVAVVPGVAQVEHEGRRVVFCSEGCRAAFVEEPARFAAAR